MSFYHGIGKHHTYFEGWYLKHQCGETTLALIPGIYKDPDGEQGAFIQILTQEASYYVAYPFTVFYARQKAFGVRIGRCLFTDQGVFLDIDTPQICIKGKILYGEFTPLHGNIMGPFAALPMQCSHGVISLRHTLNGRMTVNGKTLSFDGGTGYAEMDWGHSFPSRYLWTQCNLFERESCSIMASVAQIPFGKRSFEGCIAVVDWQGKQRRFGTYYGCRVRRFCENGWLFIQGVHCLKFELVERSPCLLKAPQEGQMSRVIQENAACTARYRLYEKEKLLFDLRSSYAGFEWVQPEEKATDT